MGISSNSQEGPLIRMKNCIWMYLYRTCVRINPCTSMKSKSYSVQAKVVCSLENLLQRKSNTSRETISIPCCQIPKPLYLARFGEFVVMLRSARMWYTYRFLACFKLLRLNIPYFFEDKEHIIFYLKDTTLHLNDITLRNQTVLPNFIETLFHITVYSPIHAHTSVPFKPLL